MRKQNLKLVAVLVVVSCCHSASRAAEYDMYAIPSWGDLACVYSSGTDPAMETPQALENMIKHWKNRGFTGVMLRTDLADMPPDQLVRNRPSEKQNPRLSLMWKHLDGLRKDFQLHAVGAKLAAKHDFKFYSFHPHTYSDGAPSGVGTPGAGRMVPWSYCMKYYLDHPEGVTVDRKGNKLWMVREYAYPEARRTKVEEVAYLARELGVRNIVICMRSELGQLQDNPAKADQYGFNQPVVNDMKRLYGVDIMTDPRFDVFSATFNTADPMVQNWRKLRGSYVTQLYRELRRALREVSPDVRLVVTLSGDHVGPPLGNWILDWRTWIDEGLIDEIITPVFFEASFDLESQNKGYLTDVRHGLGAISPTTLKDYILKSKHPEIRVIVSGGPTYFFTPPPPGGDAWRNDVWLDSYTLAWYQRWEQWKEDLGRQGHIAFLDQNFDDCPADGQGLSDGGGWGMLAHDAAQHKCAGTWYSLGNGKDSKPVAQEQVHHGSQGRAMKLTRTIDGKGALYGWHNSSPDRGLPTSCLDNAIVNGLCEFDFWVYRPDESSSLSVLLQSEKLERDIGLRIDPLTGFVSYSQAGVWIPSKHVVPSGQWQKLSIRVDLERGGYSAFGGAAGVLEICRDIDWIPPQPRTIVHLGENIPIPVPSYKYFKQVCFAPEGEAGNVSYVDDVQVRWMPAMHFTTADEVLFRDDFESYPADRADAEPLVQSGQWRIADEQLKRATVYRGTSFGEGFKSLKVTHGMDLRAVTPQLKLLRDNKKIITIDCDVFVRSNRNFPHMIPDSKSQSAHGTEIRLAGDDGKSCVAAARASPDGMWQVANGTGYADTKMHVDHDVWNHVQMAIDPVTWTYRVTVQPLGGLPVMLATTPCGPQTHHPANLAVSIRPSASTNHLTLYDNVVVGQADRTR
jgi:hypothetical protein